MSLLSNNNSAVVAALARRSMKENPFRNICIIVSIWISTALMISAPIFGSFSLLKYYEEQKYAQQIIYEGLDYETAVRMDADERLDCALLCRQGAVLRNENMFLRAVYMEYSESGIVPYRLSEGHLPGKMEEVLLDREVAADMGVTVGDSFQLWDASGKSEEFTVSGLSEDSKENLAVSHMHVSREYAQKGEFLSGRDYAVYGKIDTENVLRDQEEVIQTLYKIGEDYGVPDDEKDLNRELLDSGLFDSDRLIAYMILDGVILVTGLLVIYSVFYISVISRVAFFGQLSTIGMSRKQIRSFVNREGLRLSLEGIISGAVTAGVVTWLVNPVYWNLKLFLMVSVIVGGSSAMLIMLAVQRPAGIAAGVSPIRAARMQGGEQSRRRTYRITPLSLAWLRFCKEFRRSLFTMLSLILGGIMFFVSMSYLSSVNVENLSRTEEFDSSEYVVRIGSDENLLYYDMENRELGDLLKYGLFEGGIEEQLKDLSVVESVERVRGFTVSQTSRIDAVPAQEIATVIDREQFEKDIEPYLQGQNLTYDELVRDRGAVYTRNDDTLAYYGKQFELGDSVDLVYYNGGVKSGFRISMMGFTSKRFLREHFEMDGLLIPEETAELMLPGVDLTVSLHINTVDDVHDRDTDQKIQAVTGRYPMLQLDTLNQKIEKISRQIRVMDILFVLMSLFGTIFGIINIVNTTVTAIVSRDRELAILESAGVADRQIRRMLFWENLFLTLPAAGVSAVAGTGLGYVVVGVFTQTANSRSFKLPLLGIILFTVFMICIPWLISRGFYQFYSGKTLMERLRAEF